MSQQAGKSSKGNGEGNIQRKPNGRWEARITVGKNDNGGQKMKYFSGKTRLEASEKMDAFKNETKKGIYILNPINIQFLIGLTNGMKITL